MKMKHWAYIGIVLIAVNASLLRAVRAAEPVPGVPFYQPNFDILRFPLNGFWRKPLPAIISPVTVRLFATQKPQTLWLKNSAGFLISDQALKGDLTITIQNNKLCVFEGKKHHLVGDRLVIRSLDDQTFEVRTRSRIGKWTRGELSLHILKGHLVVVNRLGLEDYVSGIVEGELGSINLNPEVLKAQLVVARTYVLSMRGERHHGEGYEFCDNPHCQVYSGIPTGNDAGLEVALATVRGQYLSYKGRPIAAFYHHNCGGMTSAVEDVWPTSPSAYLKAVREPLNSSCQIAPHSHWRIALSRKSLAACFRKVGWLKKGDVLEAIQIIRKDRSGRVEHILIRSRRPVIVPIGRFRNVINQYYHEEYLKSALFTLTLEGDTFVFNGRGWGHGVGLCQEGAMWMARHGKTYLEILSNYFPHTKIAKLR